jgi:predicted ATPase/class 3 adenylate cyclase
MSDIEGSTRLFHHLGTGYAPLLAEHRALLRRAFAQHSGVEVETEGDALLVAFGEAADAVAATLDGQRALTAHRWPPGGEVRVRMGVHTAEASPVGAGYVSLAVHQVARICAGAHGGQVLVSQATASAAAGRLPADAALTALGTFQLRGFPTPERLSQLRHPELRADFPPLRALGVVAHNLPFQRTRFIGRAGERASLADLLRTTGVVTVVGPGGVGKTRLAVQVAFDVMDDHADGAWLVELGPLTDPALVPHAVAAALRVPEEPGRTTDDVLFETLAPKALLLVMDNCEHLLDAVAGLCERLSQHCPQLVILATSREPLDIDGEVVWRLGPLSTAVPSPGGTTPEDGAADALRLFADRAALAQPDFRLTDQNAADVASLVAHLDGIPLAIELAAATLVDRPLSAVLRGLTDRFGLLSRGRRNAPVRHQTLRAALGWSLDLLTPVERRVFARLAAFAGSGSADAAAEVCAGPPVDGAAVPAALRRLTRASLLGPHPALPDHWSMLGLVRELAAVELGEAGESDAVAARHRDWFARRVEAVEGDIGRTDGADLMRELTADHDNVRRAVETAVAAGDAAVGLRLCAAMAPFWISDGHLVEGTDRLRAVLALPGGDDRLRGRALAAAGSLLLLLGDLGEAETQFASARTRATAVGDDVTLARVLSGLGYVSFRRSRLDEAQDRWQEALGRAERAGDERVAAGILRSLAVAAGSRGDQQEAGALLDRAVASARRVRDDQLLRQLLGSSAERHLWMGEYPRAAEEYEDALEIASAIGDLSARPLLLAEQGWVALLRGNVALAEGLAVEAADLAEDVGNRRVLAHAVRLHGEILLRRNRPDDASAALDRALAVARELGAPAEIAGVRCSQASAALEHLRLDDAGRLADEAAAASALPHPMRLVPPNWVRGVAATRTGDLDAAERAFRISMNYRGQPAAPRHLANGLWGLACVSAARGRTGEAAAGHGRALELRRRMGDSLSIAESLVGLSALAAPVEPAEAARLLGAVPALLTASGASATPRLQADLSAALAAAAQAGDAATVTAAHGAGGSLQQEAAVATAARLVERLATAHTQPAT